MIQFLNREKFNWYSHNSNYYYYTPITIHTHTHTICRSFVASHRDAYTRKILPRDLAKYSDKRATQIDDENEGTARYAKTVCHGANLKAVLDQVWLVIMRLFGAHVQTRSYKPKLTFRERSTRWSAFSEWIIMMIRTQHVCTHAHSSGMLTPIRQNLAARDNLLQLRVCNKKHTSSNTSTRSHLRAPEMSSASWLLCNWNGFYPRADKMSTAGALYTCRLYWCVDSAVNMQYYAH